jgi:hypothetical protein
VRSVVTEEVNVIEAANVNAHAAIVKVTSGQLRFPGSMQDGIPRTLTEQAGCELLYLSPYSPDLNPIEKLWANLKRRWRVTGDG